MKRFAIALYDNEAESDDELNFKKNDLFQIIQIDFEGMEGWWLCKSLKTSLVGLAAGNRLKLVTDEKLLLKVNSINFEKLSAASSQSSIVSTNSSIKSIEIPLEPANTKTVTNKNKFILPAKTKATVAKSFLTESTENILSLRNDLKKKCSLTPSQEQDDDYDYDIPENNMPTSQLSPHASSESSRKSASPTIDSGISTCSLVSCNSDISIKSNKHLSSSSKSTDDEMPPTSPTQLQKQQQQQNQYDSNTKTISLKVKFEQKTENINQLIASIESINEINQSKISLLDLKACLYEFLSNIMKRCKQEHACFHFDLNVFNKFKNSYRQLKEFYLYFDSCMNTLNNVYAWNADLLLSRETNELKELLSKLIYLSETIESLRLLVDKSNFFEYHSQTASDFQPSNNKNDTKLDDNDYEYEYDNNCSSAITTNSNSCKSNDDDYEDIYESNYCQINENEISTGNQINSNNTPIPTSTSTPTPITGMTSLNYNKANTKKESSYDPMSCMTLKKNEEKIKREIRIATTNNPSESSRINLVDQMLLKFYLKHIEDNLTELKSTYDMLSQQLTNNCLHLDCQTDSLAHKLAIYGHKLVFICDTLERNINNVYLKSNLTESSSNLSESLKVYMIRIKSKQSIDNNNKKTEFLIESLDNVLNASNQFKQVIVKYYLKSF